MGATKKNKKTILQAKMQIISLYIDLIGSAGSIINELGY